MTPSTSLISAEITALLKPRHEHGTICFTCTHYTPQKDNIHCVSFHTHNEENRPHTQNRHQILGNFHIHPKGSHTFSELWIIIKDKYKSGLVPGMNCLKSYCDTFIFLSCLTGVNCHILVIADTECK